MICFHCYTQLDDSNPKACPFDRHKFSGNATRDLVQSGRLINALLNDTVAGIDYSEVEMTDEQKEKIDRYFTTYKELSPSTHVATDQQEASIHSLENDTDTLDQADELFFDMLHFDDSLPNFRFSRQNYRYYVDTLRKLDGLYRQRGCSY